MPSPPRAENGGDDHLRADAAGVIPPFLFGGGINACDFLRFLVKYKKKHLCKEYGYGKNQNEKPDRRNGRRRNDPRFVAMDQRYPHLPLCRSENRVLRPRPCQPRQDGRPGHRGRCEREQKIQGRRQVRDHHPQRAARGGVQTQTDVEEPERHHPPHPGRNGVPRAHPRKGHHALHPRLEKADRARPSRLRRRVFGRGNAHGAGRQGVPRRGRGKRRSEGKTARAGLQKRRRHRAVGAQYR